MKSLTGFILVVFLSVAAHGQSALDVAKLHTTHLLSRNVAEIGSGYGGTITLLPGHQLAEQTYGLSENGVGKKVAVSKAEYMNAFRFYAGKRREPDRRQIAALVRLLKFETVQDTGGFALDLKPGDKVVKVSHRRGNDIVLQLREVSGSWKIVGELFD